MTPPPGLYLPSPQHVCKLQRSLYGLRQASRQWYAKLSTFLLSNNYYIPAADHSLFLKYNNDKLTVILVYVDDLILTSDDREEINTITASLHHHFKIKNLGHLTYFLGLEITRNSSGLHLSQRKYTLDLLHEIGMLDFAPVATPMTHTSRLSPDQGSPLDADATSQYRRLLGRLIYLTNTQLDIAFVVHNFSQFIYAPTNHHQQAVSRLLRYLRGTPGEGLYFSHTSPLHLCGFSDSDWVTCTTTRKSVTGYFIYLGDSLISWKSKKQLTICTKHIEIDCHLVREKLNSGLPKLLPCKLLTYSPRPLLSHSSLLSNPSWA
ncbi:uncharacterized mitochondrial protein AtMg00810-like [Phaseolus vulgaris]|uniref:uncharacterized mitochondrial protein AtMg00810-like n=1 Tax=Phaseolus vulgaris TaxID=3885 RepID=UPI0035CA685B